MSDTIEVKDKDGRTHVAHMPSIADLFEIKKRLGWDLMQPGPAGQVQLEAIVYFVAKCIDVTEQECARLFDPGSLGKAVRQLAALVKLSTSRRGSLD
jgi:hypothetical protein